MRTRTLLLLATLLTLGPVWLAGVADGGGAAGEAVTRPIGRAASPELRALAVLRRWDRGRSRAWSDGDPSALARLYVAGSRTGRHDVHDLARWARRGLRVTGLHQQVRSLRVAHRTPGRLVVVVTDRTIDGVAVRGRRRTAVPASGWAVHRISLRRRGSSWRVVEAVAQPAR